MTKLILIGAITSTALMANMPLCDKTQLGEHQINNEIYRDCKQVEYDSLISKDEELAYKIPSENCTKEDKLAKKEAIKRLIDKGEYAECKKDKDEKLLAEVPDYDNWPSEKIKRYKQLRAQLKK